MRWGGIYMNSEKMANVSLLMGTMENAGITNPYLQAAILGVIGKEKAIACEVICSVIKYD